MAQYDATTLADALKEYNTPEQVKDTVYENNPWFGMLEKERTGGESYNFMVQYELSASRSHDISKVLNNKRVDKYVKFSVPTVDDYAAISIGRKIMKQTEKDEWAFFEAQQRAVDKMLKGLVRSLCWSAFRNTGASVGKISSGSTVSSTEITLDDIEEIANFGVGDVLVASANDGSSSAHTLLAGSVTLSNVDRDDGTLTATAAWNAGIGALAASYFLFKDGDFQSGAAGFDSWCPRTAPTSSDSFYGANRFPDPTRLAGVRYTATGGMPISEAIMSACARLGREGASPDTVILSHAKMRDLKIELGSKVQYVIAKPEDATISFKGVEVATDNGTVNCFADHNCPGKRSYVTRKDTWKIIYTGDDVPEIHDEDGSMLCREVGNDGFEVRASYYANFVCLEPNQTAVIIHET